MASSAEGLVKILAVLTVEEEGDPSGERFWAFPLGDDLYELNNVPFYAYDLHLFDVVRAVPPSAGRFPEITQVVRRSGHRTLRVLFAEGTPSEKKPPILDRLNELQAFYERASDVFYAFDVTPEADYQVICDQLWQWEQEGLLQYETGMTDDPDPSNGLDGDSSGG